MKAQSADYMELQTVYKSKARQDSTEVLQVVRKLEADLGRTQKIDEKEVESFCKGAGHIKLIRGHSLLVAARGKSIDWSDGAKRCGTLSGNR
jgi:NEDD8-activating enzyme E1 regulatory subunit